MNTSLTKVLITGGNGQIANSIKQQSDSSHFQFIFCAHSELDITNPPSIENAILKYQPNIIINTAAYTAVDKAESEKEIAELANHIGAKHLSEFCHQYHILLFHLSTDYIFDGKKETAYLEDDTANPISHYGYTKWLGENAIRNMTDQHYILRVSGVFSTYGTNFYNSMQKLAASNKPLRIVNDQFTCPTHADSIAKAILQMLQSAHHYGTYHFCSTPPISWHQFAERILEKKLDEISSAEYNSPAKRPLYAVLNCDKIKNVFGITQPSWEKALWDIK